MVEDAATLEVRQRIYEAVVATPGLSAREVQRQAGATWGETSYHLLRLEEAGHVVREKGVGRDFYFPQGLPSGPRALRGLGSSPSVRRVLVTVLDRPELTADAIAEAAGLTVPRVSVLLRQLVAVRLLEMLPDRSPPAFRIRDRTRLGQVLAGAAGGRRDAFLDRFVATWAEMFPP